VAIIICLLFLLAKSIDGLLVDVVKSMAKIIVEGGELYYLKRKSPVPR